MMLQNREIKFVFRGFDGKIITKEEWISDANAIAEALKDHPDRSFIMHRLGLLHGLVLVK